MRGGLQAVCLEIYSKDGEKLKYREVLYGLFHHYTKMQWKRAKRNVI